MSIVKKLVEQALFGGASSGAAPFAEMSIVDTTLTSTFTLSSASKVFTVNHGLSKAPDGVLLFATDVINSSEAVISLWYIPFAMVPSTYYNGAFWFKSSDTNTGWANAIFSTLYECKLTETEMQFINRSTTSYRILGGKTYRAIFFVLED